MDTAQACGKTMLGEDACATPPVKDVVSSGVVICSLPRAWGPVLQKHAPRSRISQWQTRYYSGKLSGKPGGKLIYQAGLLFEKPPARYS